MVSRAHQSILQCLISHPRVMVVTQQVVERQVHLGLRNHCLLGGGREQALSQCGCLQVMVKGTMGATCKATCSVKQSCCFTCFLPSRETGVILLEPEDTGAELCNHPPSSRHLKVAWSFYCHGRELAVTLEAAGRWPRLANSSPLSNAFALPF